MDQKRDKLVKEEQDLAELKVERKRMVLVSPIDGIALHGKLNRGRLGDKPSTLDKDTKVTSQQVLITLVDPKRLRIRVDLDESQLAVVTEGRQCKVVIIAFPELEATGTVKSVSKVPYAANKFDCVVALHAGKTHSNLIPTMSCELHFVDTVDPGDEGSEDKNPDDDKSDDDKSDDGQSKPDERAEG
jgi:hypothetical protein